MSSTEQVCSITAFLEDLAATNNVAIVIAATAMIDEDGRVFMNYLDKDSTSLRKYKSTKINSNQCRSFGVQCVDGSTDPTRKLGFYANNVFLQFCIQGTNCLSYSFRPSEDDLQQIP